MSFLLPVGACSETCHVDASTIHSPAGLSECSLTLETERFMTFDYVQFLILDGPHNFSIHHHCFSTSETYLPWRFQWHVLTVAQNLPLQSGTVCPQMPYLG